MQRFHKKIKLLGVLLFLALATAGVVSMRTSSKVEAAVKTGFRTINGKSYYIDADGSKHKGWLKLNGKRYYFNKKTGVQVKGWAKDSKGRKRYFTKGTGVMYTGWWKNSKGQRRYFDPKTGYMQTKWLTLNGNKYYFVASSGLAVTGFRRDSKGNTRYFYKPSGVMAVGWVSNSAYKATRYFQDSNKASLDGVMATGLTTIDGSTYYFAPKTGKMVTGWLSLKVDGSTNKYYFDPTTGVMATGVKEIDGTKEEFASDGTYIGEATSSSDPTTTASTGTRTIKNYLAGALQPVGQALYVWGGGWNDSTRKGVSPTWTKWYKKWSSNPSGYNYNNYRDLSTTNRAKGLDCSGFVGWAAYQVMQTKSGVGSGYTVVSGDIGSYYKSLGWGSIVTQSYLSKTSWKLKPGDVGYNDGHTWIVLGQCSDKSVVIIHSTPQAGCQISGTSTPTGNYSSEAIALAKKYMAKYSGYTLFEYHPSSGNYIRNGNYFRWSSSTLSDPDGYANKTADQILLDLFGY